MSRASSADIAARAWRSPRHPGRLTSTCPAGGGSYHTDRHPGSPAGDREVPPDGPVPVQRLGTPGTSTAPPTPAPGQASSRARSRTAPVGQSSRRTLTYTIRTLFLADRQRRRSAHPVISSHGSSHTGTPAGRRLAPPETTTGTASSRPIPASPPTRPFSCPARGGTAVSPAGVLILAGRAVLAEDPSRGDRARCPKGRRRAGPLAGFPAAKVVAGAGRGVSGMAVSLPASVSCCGARARARHDLLRLGRQRQGCCGDFRWMPAPLACGHNGLAARNREAMHRRLGGAHRRLDE